MYDIEDNLEQKDEEEVTIEETVDQFTERKDEESLKKWRSE